MTQPSLHMTVSLRSPTNYLMSFLRSGFRCVEQYLMPGAPCLAGFARHGSRSSRLRGTRRLVRGHHGKETSYMSNNPLANLGDLTKPATVLIEKISDAVGGIF